MIIRRIVILASVGTAVAVLAAGVLAPQTPDVAAYPTYPAALSAQQEDEIIAFQKAARLAADPWSDDVSAPAFGVAPSSKVSNQGAVAIERERVALRRADHAAILSPVDKGVSGIGCGCDGVRSAFGKCATAADSAVGTGQGPDRNGVLLRVDGQRRDAGRDLIVGCVVEIDDADVGAGR
jgi:hypothetical protein